MGSPGSQDPDPARPVVYTGSILFPTADFVPVSKVPSIPRIPIQPGLLFLPDLFGRELVDFVPVSKVSKINVEVSQ